MPKPRKPKLKTLTIAIPDGEAPTEFRIFAAGLNTTQNGYNVLFDDKAASMTMAAWAAHGVDLMLDLEHLSLDSESQNFDPDARGWADLEVRPGPELWAVNVRWTPDGARRLAEKTQRYVSPAFFTDADDRLARVVNVGLVALPATDDAMPLVASLQHKGKPMFALSKAIVALATLRRLSTAGHSPSVILHTLSEGDGEVAPGVDTKALAEFLEVAIDPASDPAGFIAALLAKLDEVRAKLSGGAPEPPPVEAKEEPKPEEMAAARLMLRVLGDSSFSDGIVRLNDWKQIIVGHDAEKKKLSEDRAAIELLERKGLVVRLQKCGAETPATSGLGDGVLCKRLAAEPLPALKARVEALELAASSRGQSSAPLAPAQHVEGLTERELKKCAERKIDPAKYAAMKTATSLRTAAKGA